LARLQKAKIQSEDTVAQIGPFLSVPNGTVPFDINRFAKLSVCNNEALQKNRFVKFKIEQK